MFVLGKGYEEARKKYVVELANYFLSSRLLRSNNIKMLLLNKIKKVQFDRTGKGYELYFDDEDLFKALLGDIHLFYIKSLLQWNDNSFVDKNVEISPNWNIVTSYYSTFFDVCLLMRLFHRGNLFFDDSYKNELSRVMSIYLDCVIALDSKMLFKIEKKNDNYVLLLTKDNLQTHESVWKQCHEIIQELLLLSSIDMKNRKNKEIIFLKACLSVITKLGYKFPSQMRNKVNYQAIYGLEAIEHKFYRVNHSIDWMHEIMCFDGQSKDYSDSKIIDIYTAYSKYIHVLTYKMIEDYYEMTGRENNILAKVNEDRDTLIAVSRNVQ